VITSITTSGRRREPVAPRAWRLPRGGVALGAAVCLVSLVFAGGAGARLHVYAADVLVRHGVDREGFR